MDSNNYIKQKSSFERARPNRLQLCLAVVSACLLGHAGAASAQAYPNKPIRIIVPYAPGGGVDAVARPIADKLSKSLGQPVIVENKPGAGGNLGAAYVARVKPDGYTLLVHAASIASNPYVWKSVGYDVVKDFSPIATLALSPSVLAVNPKVPATTLAELAAYSKTEPLDYASAGTGTASHLVGETINSSGILKLVHIPYRGSGPATIDAISGQIDAVLVPLSVVAPFFKQGKLRPIAMLGRTRSTQAPDIPTFVEAGYPTIYTDGWYGLLAPAGTPADIVKKLSDATRAALQDPDTIKHYQQNGYEVAASTPEELAATIKEDAARWEAMAKNAKLEKQ